MQDQLFSERRYTETKLLRRRLADTDRTRNLQTAHVQHHIIVVAILDVMTVVAIVNGSNRKDERHVTVQFLEVSVCPCDRAKSVRAVSWHFGNNANRVHNPFSRTPVPSIPTRIQQSNFYFQDHQYWHWSRRSRDWVVPEMKPHQVLSYNALLSPMMENLVEKKMETRGKKVPLK